MTQKIKIRSLLPAGVAGAHEMFELLWATPTEEEGKYILQNIPLDPNLNLYDVVIAPRLLPASTGEVPMITGIAERGGQTTFSADMSKIGFFNTQLRKRQKAMLTMLRDDLGGSTENRDDGRFGISVPIDKYETTRDILLKALQDQVIDSFARTGVGNRWS